MAAKLGDNLSVQEGNPAKPSGFSNSPPPATKIAGVKKVRIILEDNPDIPPTGLFIGHNGNSFMIRTGVEVDVPEPLLEILDRAITSVPIVNSHSLQVMGSRQKQRFAYRVIREAA